MSTTIYGIDDDLGQGMGCLRDYVATGLISRGQVELTNSEISFEATIEADVYPGTARPTTVRISETAYNDLGALGVP